jgi:hypothetical protein
LKTQESIRVAADLAANFVGGSDVDAVSTMIVENIHHASLTPTEEAAAHLQLAACFTQSRPR